jgi:hypothetical protein
MLDLLQPLKYDVQIGGWISAVGEGTCDDEVSVARKMRTGNQSLAVLVLVISAS